MAQDIEDFKRPNHPDFMDSAELKKANFSGIRHNSLTGEAEVWKYGIVVSTVSKKELLYNPNAIQEAIAEVYRLDEAVPDSPEIREYHKKQAEEEEKNNVIIIGDNND